MDSLNLNLFIRNRHYKKGQIIEPKLLLLLFLPCIVHNCILNYVLNNPNNK